MPSARKIAISGYWRKLAKSHSIMPSSLLALVLGERVWLQQLQALPRVVAVDLLHVELAHERDDFLRNDLAGHHDRKARRVRDHELCRHELRALGQPVVDGLAVELHVFTV